jgi:hypothetical protein
LAGGFTGSVTRRPRKPAAFVASAFLGLLVCIALSACGANVNLRVDVNRSGAGTVTLAVTFPSGTAAQVEDLKNGLPVSDLRATGWVVDGPHAGPAGSTVVSATHAFSDLSQVPALVADIAGSGPEAARPFRLAVNEQTGFLANSYTASGSVDLQCSLACFDDPKLAASVGYALGVPSSEVRQLVADPAKEIAFRVEVVLPGQVTTSDASARASTGALVWSPVLGEATTVTASSEVVDKGRVQALGIAVGAGAVVVVVTAMYVVWSGRRGRRGRRRRRRGGLSFR